MMADTPLAPKLRFPEFKKEPDWKLTHLSNAAQFVNDRISVSAIAKDEYVSTENILPDFAGIAPPSSFPASGSVTRFRINDVLVSNIRPYLKKVWRATRRGGASNDVLVVRSKSGTSDDYLAAILKSDAFIDYVMGGAKGVKMPRGDIGLMKKYPVGMPQPAEQQKVADCLGSLDGLIAAEGRKLKTLRQHKQGLMQQLFPRPGETAPRLRFPEFRDGSTWLAPQLDDLYDFKRTNTLSRDKLNYETGTIRNIHYGDIHTKFKPLFRVGNEHVPYINPDASANGFDDDAFCEEGDIVLADASEDLDDVGKAIEIVSLDGERVVAGTHTILATRRGSVPVVGFGGQLFQSAVVRAGIKKEAQGAKVYGISANRISAVPVPVPPTEPEQQRIADCLGWLDGLIAAEGRKLEALRQHKQGLMQRLFPSPEGR